MNKYNELNAFCRECRLRSNSHSSKYPIQISSLHCISRVAFIINVLFEYGNSTIAFGLQL